MLGVGNLSGPVGSTGATVLPFESKLLAGRSSEEFPKAGLIASEAEATPGAFPRRESDRRGNCQGADAI
jgi:hypothetical protein